MNHDFKDKVAFITGASSGIGEALAIELAKQGAILALVARRLDRLESLSQQLSSQTKVLVLQVDVCNEAEIKSAIEKTLSTFGKIDLVIANAGRGISGDLDSLSVQSFRDQFETNVFGVLHTVYPSLKSLQAAKGRLVIIGSVMSYVSYGGSAPYSMSKYAVRALAESLFHELKPKGVSVTLVCPGLVESEIRIVDNDGRLHADLKDPVPSWLLMPRRVAARKILRSAANRRRELLLTMHGRLAIFLKSHFPFLFHWLIERLNVRSGKQKARFKQQS